MAGSMLGVEVEVYMVRASYDLKPYRRGMMETFGASVIPSPSDRTDAGKAILAEAPDSPGSLGIAISEAVEMAVKDPGAHYALGSVLNHVMVHQSVIGLEALEQMEMAGDYPDVIVGATGGGSNFAGISFPFIGRKLRGERDVRVVAVEPAACPSLTKGSFAYDFGDTAHLTPLLKMHTLGSTFIPPSIHAGGLRYHGMSPLVSHLHNSNVVEATNYNQMETFSAGIQFAKAEGIIPAPEANHAVVGAITEALRAKGRGHRKDDPFQPLWPWAF